MVAKRLRRLKKKLKRAGQSIRDFFLADNGKFGLDDDYSTHSSHIILNNPKTLPSLEKALLDLENQKSIKDRLSSMPLDRSEHGGAERRRASPVPGTVPVVLPPVQGAQPRYSNPGVRPVPTRDASRGPNAPSTSTAKPPAPTKQPTEPKMRRAGRFGLKTSSYKTAPPPPPPLFPPPPPRAPTRSSVDIKRSDIASQSSMGAVSSAPDDDDETSTRGGKYKGDKADKDAIAQCMLRLEMGVAICGLEEKRERGTFTADDMLMILAILGYTVIQYDLEMFLDSCDLPIKDAYTYEEVAEVFLEMMDKNQGDEGAHKEEVLIQAVFAYFDRDDNGAIDVEEMRRAYEELGTALTDADIQSLTAVMDAHNGTITLEDFKAISKGLDLATEVIRRPVPPPRKKKRRSIATAFVGFLARRKSSRSVSEVSVEEDGVKRRKSGSQLAMSVLSALTRKSIGVGFGNRGKDTASSKMLAFRGKAATSREGAARTPLAPMPVAHEEGMRLKKKSMFSRLFKRSGEKAGSQSGGSEKGSGSGTMQHSRPPLVDPVSGSEFPSSARTKVPPLALNPSRMSHLAEQPDGLSSPLAKASPRDRWHMLVGQIKAMPKSERSRLSARRRTPRQNWRWAVRRILKMSKQEREIFIASTRLPRVPSGPIEVEEIVPSVPAGPAPPTSKVGWFTSHSPQTSKKRMLASPGNSSKSLLDRAGREGSAGATKKAQVVPAPEPAGSRRNMFGGKSVKSPPVHPLEDLDDFDPLALDHAAVDADGRPAHWPPLGNLTSIPSVTGAILTPNDVRKPSRKMSASRLGVESLVHRTPSGIDRQVRFQGVRESTEGENAAAVPPGPSSPEVGPAIPPTFGHAPSRTSRTSTELPSNRNSLNLPRPALTRRLSKILSRPKSRASRRSFLSGDESEEDVEELEVQRRRGVTKSFAAKLAQELINPFAGTFVKPGQEQDLLKVVEKVVDKDASKPSPLSSAFGSTAALTNLLRPRIKGTKTMGNLQSILDEERHLAGLATTDGITGFETTTTPMTPTSSGLAKLKKLFKRTRTTAQGDSSRQSTACGESSVYVSAAPTPRPGESATTQALKPRKTAPASMLDRLTRGLRPHSKGTTPEPESAPAHGGPLTPSGFGDVTASTGAAPLRKIDLSRFTKSQTGESGEAESSFPPPLAQPPHPKTPAAVTGLPPAPPQDAHGPPATQDQDEVAGTSFSGESLSNWMSRVSPVPAVPRPVPSSSGADDGEFATPCGTPCASEFGSASIISGTDNPAFVSACPSPDMLDSFPLEDSGPSDDFDALDNGGSFRYRIVPPNGQPAILRAPVASDPLAVIKPVSNGMARAGSTKKLVTNGATSNGGVFEFSPAPSSPSATSAVATTNGSTPAAKILS